MAPLLSVIVPIYKVEPYLRQCVESILGQTFQDMEIILVDDGSPDGCPAICDHYAEMDARVKVIHKQNGGLVNARKDGVRFSTGRYITFVDGDDWIDSGMYQAMWERIQMNHADILTTDYFYDGGHPIRNTAAVPEGIYRGKSLENLCDQMIYSGKFYQPGVFPVVWNKWFRREILLPNLFAVNENLTLGEDLACTYACILDAKCVEIYKSQCFYHYRIRQESMTKDFDQGYFRKCRYLYDYMDVCFADKKREDLQEQLKYHKVWMVMLGIKECAGGIRSIFTGRGRKNVEECYGDRDLARCMDGVDASGMKLPFLYRETWCALEERQTYRILVLTLLLKVPLFMEKVCRLFRQRNGKERL